MSTALTTIIEIQNTIRFRQGNGVSIHGDVVGIDRQQGAPVLQVSRRCDGHVVPVRLSQVLKVCKAVTAVPTSTPVPGAVPWVAGLLVKYLDHSGWEVYGTIREVEHLHNGTASLLVERNDTTLDLVESCNVLALVVG